MWAARQSRSRLHGIRISTCPRATARRRACTHPGQYNGRGGRLRQRLPDAKDSRAGWMETRYDSCALRTARRWAREFFDDNWNHLNWVNGTVTVKVIRSCRSLWSGHHRVLRRRSRRCSCMQPPTKQFVAIEHQYNFWRSLRQRSGGKTDTGMVTLKPAPEHTKWHVRLHVFVP